MAAAGSGDVLNSCFDDDDYLLSDAAYVNYGSRRRSNSSRSDDSSFRFTPPLYRQRYTAVINELRKDLDFVDKVVDFGCAEGGFLSRARDALGKQVDTFVGVDLDEQVVKGAQSNLTPHSYHFYYCDDENANVPSPVTYLFKGNIAEYDDRLDRADAVVAIELVEHLYADVLQGGVDMIFSRLRPYVVIFTTPNVEFNVLFNMGDRQFRHDDHKFEWTRKEFETWCNSIVAKYPKYVVEFSGIGTGPSETEESIGGASQMAVFRWKRKTTYFQLKEKRMKELRDLVKTNHAAVVEHMNAPCTGSSEIFSNGKRHEHPYELIAKINLPTDIIYRNRRKRAVADCREYCRQIYYERLDLEKRAALNADYSIADSLIVTDPETGIRGTWIDVEELYARPAVQHACDSPADIASLLMSEDNYISDGGGFASVCKRVMYQDEDDVMVYRNRCDYGSEDEYENENENANGYEYENETEAENTAWYADDSKENGFCALEAVGRSAALFNLTTIMAIIVFAFFMPVSGAANTTGRVFMGRAHYHGMAFGGGGPKQETTAEETARMHPALIIFLVTIGYLGFLIFSLGVVYICETSTRKAEERVQVGEAENPLDDLEVVVQDEPAPEPPANEAEAMAQLGDGEAVFIFPMHAVPMPAAP